MTRIELEEALDELLPAGFSLETNKKGEIIIFTNLTELEEDGELSILDEDEVDPDFDPDFDPLDEEDNDD